MLTILKYLKKSIIPIIFIITLLFIQATCDLSLPEYTSKIVNIGIQQSGIESNVPKVISESIYQKIILFLNDKDKNIFEECYYKLDKNLLTKKGYNKYKKKYPLIEKEILFELKSITNDRQEELNKILSKPLMIIGGLSSNSEQVKVMKEKMLQGMGIENSDNVDIFALLTNISNEQKQNIIKEIEKSINVLPESIINQASIAYVKIEYQKVGIKVNDLQTNYIVNSGLKMLGIALVAMIASIIVGLLGARIAAKVAQTIRSSVFNKIVSFSETEFKKFSTASLITRTTNDIQQVQMVMVMLLRTVIYAPIMGIGGVIKVLNTNTSMGWIIALAVACISVIVLTLFIVVIPKFKLLQKLIDKLNLVSREILSGIPVIRAFSTQKHEEKRFDKANVELKKTNLFVSRVMSLMMPLMMLIMNGIAVLIVWVGAHAIDKGTMQVGDMMAFIQYMMQIMISFLMISFVSIILPRASVSMSRIDEVLMTENVINDPEESESFIKIKRGYIEFKNVSFKYPDADENVLTNIDFVAKPGQTTAFIGSTGSGKSTIVNLIPRFYDVSEGSILVDGVDIRQVTQLELRSKIGYVPQKGVLFSGTIASNIKFGNKKTTDTQMKKASEIAQASEFILAKKEKFNYKIAQGGTNVSGGQKQRLSIARAIAKEPDIFIFDDSFSALDFKTDSTLRATLKKELADKTILIVTQRVSTILNAEQIIVLDNGKIVGKGTHKELLKNCEVYREIAASQLSKEELK